MKAFLAAVFALWGGLGLAFAHPLPPPPREALENAQPQPADEHTAALEKRRVAQAATEHAQALREYPAWLVQTIASEFTAILDAGKHFLADPSQRNLELFRAAKKDQLQRVGVHICKFDDASQRIAQEERKRLTEQLAGMLDAFAKEESALEAKISGRTAEQQQRQERLAR